MVAVSEHCEWWKSWKSHYELEALNSQLEDMVVCKKFLTGTLSVTNNVDNLVGLNSSLIWKCGNCSADIIMLMGFSNLYNNVKERSKLRKAKIIRIIYLP